jgi:hypothetical protein
MAAEKMGVDFNKDFNAQSHDDFLTSLAKIVGYRKSFGGVGSTGRRFFYYLQKLKGNRTNNEAVNKKEKRPLSWYEYETARITVLWNGHTQPLGFFKSAIDAKKAVDKLKSTLSVQTGKWELRTPNGIIPI